MSASIIRTIERGIKGTQLTTLYKIAEANNINFIEFATIQGYGKIKIFPANS